MKKLNKFYFIWGAAVLIAVSFLIIPLKLPYTVESYGKILPSKKWVLAKGTAGQLIASEFNYETGLNEGYSVSQFERGEAMRFSFHPAIGENGFVSAGDTIGSIYSSDTEERLVELNGQLALARATLAVNTGGEKESIIRESEQRLAHAEAEATEQQKILARIKNMYQQNLVSQQEYDTADNKANLLDIQVSIAASQLEAARTGEKPEQIKFVQSKIAALQQEIEILQKRLNSFSIIAPIGGKISRVFSSDTLLVISDTSSYLAFIPVKLEDYPYISRGQNVKLYHNSLSKIARGKLVSIETEINFLSGKQVLLATASLTNFSSDLLPGMLTGCAISCEPITGFEYAKRFVTSILN